MLDGVLGRVSDPGTSTICEPAAAAGRTSDTEGLSSRLWRLHVTRRPGCPAGAGRRRPLLVRPARLKPASRPLLRQPRLLPPARVFGAAAPQRCCQFSQLLGAGQESAVAGAGQEFAGAGAPVFSEPPPPPHAAAAEPGAGSDAAGPPTTACSLQHRQRRPASVDELAGLVSQVTIMSSMAEMMYT